MPVVHRGLTVGYRSQGTGDAMLLLSDPCDARCDWWATGYAACLARTYRVIAPVPSRHVAGRLPTPDDHRPERLATFHDRSRVLALVRAHIWSVEVQGSGH